MPDEKENGLILELLTEFKKTNLKIEQLTAQANTLKQNNADNELVEKVEKLIEEFSEIKTNTKECLSRVNKIETERKDGCDSCKLNKQINQLGDWKDFTTKLNNLFKLVERHDWVLNLLTFVSGALTIAVINKYFPIFVSQAVQTVPTVIK